jgi:NAD(P)H-hydrate epimerase
MTVKNVSFKSLRMTFFMGDVIKKSEVKKLYPRRDPFSRKGQNGRVLIIGGSANYFGAPILAGLGALGSGSDLVYLLVPDCNFEVSRSFYPDFIVRKYPGSFINSRTIDAVAELLPHVDALLIGPGIGKNPENSSVIERIIQKATCPVILDAEAISAIKSLKLPDEKLSITITPHHGEFSELIGEHLPEDFEAQKGVVKNFVEKSGITVLLKGPNSIIAMPEQEPKVNITGNAGMTVGGSGDVLAGFVSSLIAQRVHPSGACMCASFLFGAAGDNLYHQKGYNFMATDLALELPYTIHAIVD